MRLFSKPTVAWLDHAFDRPTDVQRQAWPAIRSGENVLVVAPTGSGKTLCAFLSAIDHLMTSRGGSSDGKDDTERTTGADDAANRSKEHSPASAARNAATTEQARRGVTILYISPLKALGVDVAKNLEAPLAGIAEQCAAMGLPAPKISVAMRSGDTTPQERRRIVSHPPDILVTTPESLFLLLTSKARRILKTVETVIVDEVHAIAGSKRGAHLAVSLERLDALTGRRAQRIGLSATVNPIDEAARFLGGAEPVTIVNPGTRPTMDLRVADPLPNMLDTGATGGSVWPAIEQAILDEVLSHHTTLVFVNSRGLAEKLTARLNDRYTESCEFDGTEHRDLGSPEGREHFAGHYDSVVGATTTLVSSHNDGEVIAMAHHGSVSKDRRKQIEEQLKRGELRCVVATSSLELGIDMGSVDLVIQVAVPLSVSSGLQRVGRADHKVGGVSHAVFYPVTRQQIIGMAASLESMRAGAIEPLTIPNNPLDVLAQQTVAAAAMEDLKPDAWYAEVRGSAPFAKLDRTMFDAVVGMMTGAYNSEDFSAFRPPLQMNEEAGLISARPGAQRLAVTSGGTIPDRGMYTVVLPEENAGSGPRKVGELDEEMVYESRVGDVITLGTSTWQIQEITRDRVIVVPAPGRTARLPFWHGDESGRDYRFGLIQGRLAGELGQALTSAVDSTDDVPAPHLHAAMVDRLKQDGLDDNAIGNLTRLLEEQRAATGTIPNDRTLVLERCRDEGGDWRIILHSPYGRRVHEPWALAITARIRRRYGFDAQAYATDDGIVLRLPDGYENLRAADILLFDVDDMQRVIETQIGGSVLYMARFRECAARSLFLPRTSPGRRVPLWQQRLRASQLLSAARTCRNFPLLLETARECLQDVYDLPALRTVMSGLNAGTIAVHEATTGTPSPFAENMLFGFVGSVMYQYDVPQAERSTQLLSMDPEVLERLLGTTDMASLLDQSAIAQVADELRGRTFWNTLPEDDVTGRITRYAKTHGPFTADEMIDELRLDAVRAVHVLDELDAKGKLLKGHFLAEKPGQQWLYIDVFRRIRTLSLAKARKAIKPVSQQSYQAFLLDRQGVGPVGAERYEGVDGLMRVIEQLEGVFLNAFVWESAVFPIRVRDYHPSMLDELIASGDVVWVGRKNNGTMSKEAGDIAFHPADSPLLAAYGGPASSEPSDSESLTVPEAVLSAFRNGGAFHARRLSALAQEAWQQHADVRVNPDTGEILFPTWDENQFEEALWALVWRGKITNGSFAPVRALARGDAAFRPSPHAVVPRWRSLHSHDGMGTRTGTSAAMGGLWSAVTASGETNDVGSDEPHGRERPQGNEERGIASVESLLDRYGIVAAPLIDKEDVPGGFSGLYPVLKRMEEHGMLVRGMFVQGFGAAQFARKDTIDALRDDHQGHSRSCVALDATDPANLTGAAIAWPEQRFMKPARRSGSIIVFRQGAPALFAVPKSHKIVGFTEDETVLRQSCAELGYALQRRSGGVSFSEMNGESLKRRNAYMRLLKSAGFTESPQGMRLYR